MCMCMCLRVCVYIARHYLEERKKEVFPPLPSRESVERDFFQCICVYCMCRVGTSCIFQLCRVQLNHIQPNHIQPNHIHPNSSSPPTSSTCMKREAGTPCMWGMPHVSLCVEGVILRATGNHIRPILPSSVKPRSTKSHSAKSHSAKSHPANYTLPPSVEGSIRLRIE